MKRQDGAAPEKIKQRFFAVWCSFLLQLYAHPAAPASIHKSIFRPDQPAATLLAHHRQQTTVGKIHQEDITGADHALQLQSASERHLRNWLRSLTVAKLLLSCSISKTLCCRFRGQNDHVVCGKLIYVEMACGINTLRNILRLRTCIRRLKSSECRGMRKNIRC